MNTLKTVNLLILAWKNTTFQNGEMYALQISRVSIYVCMLSRLFHLKNINRNFSTDQLDCIVSIHYMMGSTILKQS